MRAVHSCLLLVVVRFRVQSYCDSPKNRVWGSGEGCGGGGGGGTRITIHTAIYCFRQSLLRICIMSPFLIKTKGEMNI